MECLGSPGTEGRAWSPGSRFPDVGGLKRDGAGKSPNISVPPSCPVSQSGEGEEWAKIYNCWQCKIVGKKYTTATLQIVGESPSFVL